MSNYRIMYLRDSYYMDRNGVIHPGQPIGCLAIQAKGKKISFGLSVLNPNDKFNRTTANELACHRMKEKPHAFNVVGIGNNQLTMHNITESVMRYLASEDVPARARRAAKLWLQTNL